jgi:hypothetical protein
MHALLTSACIVNDKYMLAFKSKKKKSILLNKNSVVLILCNNECLV